ncbi:MAG TPA: pyridoxal-phosphate dependent enzyme [Candidatus Polarisedimenticolaceae bacterium]|nr:pyridoxal-phosphate dependent enzyme [Candidatus Polarisedimenticolaceae bacterium]
MILEDFDGKCFLCGTAHGSFDTARRLCECVHPQGFQAGELCCYASILPEPRDYRVEALPSLWAAQPPDVFAIGSPPQPADRRDAAREPPYPFRSDTLASAHNLHCGNTLVHRSTALEDVTGFEQVHVINMSSYHWTSTLKDPRSWAIVNTALLHGVTELAVWTAGNAGLSLAKIVYVANRRLPRERRLQVYAIVDNDVAPEIRMQLKLWQCEVLDIFRRDKPVLNPAEIRGLVAARLKRSRRLLDEARYWDVTDGWDGVGLLMYRYLAAQILRDMVTPQASGEHAPSLVAVLPVGTGDLLLGFYLGALDCERAGLIRPGDWAIIGALPRGANILQNVRQRAIPHDAAERSASAIPERDVPVMPKLTSSYTPLAPCLAKLDASPAVEFLLVGEQDQLRAGKHVLAAGVDEGLACEPSALAAFAALPHVYARLHERTLQAGSWRYQSTARVLVVNSGLGVLGRAEDEFLRRVNGA